MAVTGSWSASTSARVSDLRGKKMVLAESSPSHYFALNMLVAGGLQPAEVQMVFTPDAFQAAAAFNSQQDLAAAVSWAPDIYNLSEVQGNRLLVTTTDGQQTDRGRLVRPRRFCAGSSRDHRGVGARHLRRHGRTSRVMKRVRTWPN